MIFYDCVRGVVSDYQTTQENPNKITVVDFDSFFAK
jgi:hypothetical protein